MNKNLLVDAAIATGAFPLGLAPRVVIRDPKYINDNQLLKLTRGKPWLVDPVHDYNTVCVDGGVINNEPYDLTEAILTNRRKEDLKRSANKKSAEHFQLAKSASAFDTTILMIDPFPNYEDKPSSGPSNLQALKYTSPGLLASMRQQLMVKTDLLQKAYDDNDYTRFMISPIRSKGEITQPNSLACGALGGFGGFFSKDFRIHDYLLGRRNCQRFIQYYFCVPADAKNPVIEYGYGSLSENQLKFIPSKNQALRPIIPDIRLNQNQNSLTVPKPEAEFKYPSVGVKYLLKLEDKLKSRLKVVVDNIVNTNDPESETHPGNPIIKKIRKKSWVARNILNLATKRFIPIGKNLVCNLAAEKFIDAVITDMDKKGLLKNDL